MSARLTWMSPYDVTTRRASLARAMTELCEDLFVFFALCLSATMLGRCKLWRNAPREVAGSYRLLYGRSQMTLEDVRSFVAAVPWKFAKTMPQNPHEYTLRKASPEREAEFEAVVMFIR